MDSWRAVKARNEARCERILDTCASSPLALDDIDWDRAARTPVEPEVLDVLVYMRDVEGFTDRDLVGLTAHRTTLGDPIVARFLDIWRAEEAVHSATLGRFLDAHAARHGAHLAPRQLPPPAVVPRRERVLARIGPGVGPVVATAHMAWGAANELLTLNGYRLLAARCGNAPLAEILRRIATQEARHFSFYLLQAEWRLRASRLARAVLPRVLRGTWTPVGVGDGYKSDAEFAAVYAYLARGADGERIIDRMDRRFAALPGFDGLRIYRHAAVTIALRPQGPRPEGANMQSDGQSPSRRSRPEAEQDPRASGSDHAARVDDRRHRTHAAA